MWIIIFIFYVDYYIYIFMWCRRLGLKKEAQRQNNRILLSCSLCFLTLFLNVLFLNVLFLNVLFLNVLFLNTRNSYLEV